MLLALDVGNTHVVVGLMEGRQVRRSFRIATRRDNAVGDYAVALSQLLELAEVDRQEVEQVIISSVVPPVTRALQGAARLLTGKEPLVVGGNVRCRIPVRADRSIRETAPPEPSAETGTGVSAAAAAGRHGYRHHGDGAG